MDNFYFVVRYRKTRRRKNIFQILYQLKVKLTFFYFGINISFIKIFEYFLDMPAMFGHVVGVDK